VKIHALFENGRGQRQKGAPTVRKRGFLVALVVVMMITMVFDGAALAGKPGRGTVLEANLTGTGDTDGAGYFHATTYPAKNKICYRISASNIGTATAAHLHVKRGERRRPDQVEPQDAAGRQLRQGVPPGPQRAFCSYDQEQPLELLRRRPH
jgi:hypothetical protein